MDIGRPVEVKLCGGLELLVNGRPIDLRKTARQGRLVLAYLALHRGRPVTREELMEQIWAEPDPRRVGASLSQTLSRLRGILGPEALQRLPNGAQCLRGDIRTDVEEAESDLRRARAQIRAGAYAAAASAAQAVLARLNGEVLLGDAAEWLEPVRRHTEEWRTEAFELLAAAELRLGELAAAEAAARAAVERGGAHEETWALLMEAQALRGDTAGATRTFHEVRARLRDDYGLTPGQRLIALHDRLIAGEAQAATEPATTELPARLAQAARTRFVGRESEWDALVRAWGRVRTRGPGIALIAGEPGIGKTRLIAALATVAHDEGATVLYGRCEEDVGAAYQPWVDVLQQCVEAAPGAVAHRSALARLAPEAVPGAEAPSWATDPEAERYLLFGAIRTLLCEVAQERPMLLVLDDLHWADKPTLLLLRHLATSGAGMRVLLLGAYRNSEVGDALDGVLADLHEAEADRVFLAGFTTDDVLALMESGVGARALTDAERQLAAELVADTGGNPFFVVQVLRHLIESGAIARRDGSWRLTVAGAALPASVREVIGRRVRRLGREAAHVLRAAAVAGQEFDVGVLARALGQNEDAILEAVEVAVGARLAAEVGRDRFTFSHALVRHALAEELSVSRRARLHDRIADSLELAGGGARLGEIAHHRIAAGSDPGRAIAAAAAAGRGALERLGPDEAIRWFRAGLELAADAGADRCELLLCLGEAQRQGGDPAYRQTLLEAAGLARQLGDDERMVRAALSNSRGFESASGNVDAERVAVLRAALAEPSVSGARRARLEAQLQLELTFVEPLAERRRLSDHAVAAAEEAGDAETLAHVLWARHAVLWTPDLLEEHFSNAARLEVLAAQLDDPVTAFWAACDRVLVSVWSSDLAAADRGLATMQDVADSVGQPILRWIRLWYGAWRAYLAGELEQSASLAQRAGEAGVASGQPDAEAFQLDQMLPILRDRGALGTVVELLESIVAEQPGLPVFRAWLTLAYCTTGRAEEGGALLAGAAASRFRDIPWDILWLHTLCLYAEAAAVLGARPEAALLRDALAPYPDFVAFNSSSVLGSVAGFLGRLSATLGDWIDAESQFARALESAERLEAPCLIARACLGWAAAVTAEGAPDAAERAEALRARAEELTGDRGLVGVAVETEVG